MNNKPSIQEMVLQAREVLTRFESKKMLFLTTKGQLLEKPVSLDDKISNELLYRIKILKDEELSVLVWSIFNPFIRDEDAWSMTRTMYEMLCLKDDDKKSFSSFVIVFSVLVWIIKYEVIRMNSNAFASEWDREAQEIKRTYCLQYEELNTFLNSHSMDQKNYHFVIKILEEIKKCSLGIISLVSENSAAGDKCTLEIKHLLQEAEGAEERKDEISSTVIEKIQPFMGIVTNASPGLLFPCLEMLMNEKIAVSSGIPYHASVTLSILQDPRSTEVLLQALRECPLYYSKIRENIIYTLGSLKEPKTVDILIKLLEMPDEIVLEDNKSSYVRKCCSMIKQKEEAVWALGTIGLGSINAIPLLAHYADHSSEELQFYLAWALGEIGAAQKEYCGGLNVDIAITLLKLLKTKKRRLFEETVSALRKVDIPEFTHSLYLYNVGAISILGLKPARKALYELSETLHYLLSTKKRVIMAVNGDSGTGKTYFCKAIMQGFGDLKPHEIVYLMRDRKQDQKIFDQMLGSEWLNKYIEPSHYLDTLSYSNENPDIFFKQFLQEHSDKKLIILDGCRDESFFQRIIDLFYMNGELDVEVTFRATFSTRRRNLERREVALESVKRHLAFLETPILEDTQLYQEGVVILYDLNNSISNRLDEIEIKEVFERRKIDSWGDLIRIGDFHQEPHTMDMIDQKCICTEQDFVIRMDELPAPSMNHFVHGERKFKAILNNDLTTQPNLLQIIEMNDLKPKQIKFYAQDQIAGLGEESDIFVLTFTTNRIFFASLGETTGMTLLGRDIFFVDPSEGLKHVSFERDEVTTYRRKFSSAGVLTSFLRDKIVTGHNDGTIRIWDFAEKNIKIIEGHSYPIVSLMVDYMGRIYSGSSDNSFRQWDIESRKVKIVHGSWRKIPFIKLYPPGKVVMIAEETALPDKICILDFQSTECNVITASFEEKALAINVYLDGRIVAAVKSENIQEKKHAGNLLVISPSKDACRYKRLEGHTAETVDCFTMGPKIISCGIEKTGIHTLRVWGTEFYVDMELRKLLLQPSS